MWCAGFMPKKFVFRILSMTSELSEIVRWKLWYGHVDLGVCVPFLFSFGRGVRASLFSPRYEYTLHLMPEWEQDFFPFCPSSPKYYSYFEILKFNQNKQTKKRWGGDYSFADVQINNCICVNMHDCNRSNKFNACPQMSIFYCACVWALLLWPICSKAILIRIFSFQEKSCSKDCLRIWVHLRLFQCFLLFSVIDIVLLVQRNFM